ncbi:MAG: UDP-N-acetylmuramate dehydrogenase [Chloroflexi bacterium]|nr:UDP-N-acetylmuramate dehydrogenase [Chloroflexota bacterium]
MIVPEHIRRVAGDRLRLDEPLADHTSFRIGGPADYFVLADRVPLLVDLVRAANADGVPWLILGRGSNVLVSDRGVRGLVIRNQADGLSIDRQTGLVRAESGLRLASLATQTARAGLTGLEFGIGIPGSVGGAVVMNAGAHGASFGDHLIAVEALTAAGEVARLRREELALGYRTSRFHHDRKAVVLGAELQLPEVEPRVALEQIARFRQRRHETQPTDPGAGSIFKNPPGDAAGRLIDVAGLKGRGHGGAVVSPKHGNFIVNVGGATAADVLALAEVARVTVAERFGVTLELEVERVGEW